jgi:molecular chaperone HtpG
MSEHKFKTEVNQLLHLIIHSLYSNTEIFLRELISNSSDALDKLKYLTLTDDKYRNLYFDPRIDVYFGKPTQKIITLSDDGQKQKIISVSDNGIGMNDKDMEKNLGTIAKSGTQDFMKALTGDAKKDSNLIGEFGVGFYSSFMVAEKVEVISRKAGGEDAFMWSSNGKGRFEITDAARESHGTTVILHLNENGEEFSNRWKLDGIIKKYSNHIPFPIFLHFEETRSEGEGAGKKEVREQKEEQVNAASALWRRPKAELKDEDYREFYKTISHGMDEPLLHIHTKAEGKIEYTTLFYIPKKAPVDLFWADYIPGVKLYIKRVFITDDEKELLPRYLRFVRGIIDSEDLPLNVSREMLQQDRVLTSIKNASVKKILGEILELKKDGEKYNEFYKEFSRPLKEGVYQDYNNRDTLLELLQFKSTKVEGYTGFAGYKERMKPEQKAVYYITGENEQNLRNSPLLEAYKEKDIEVLIMDEDIDEIVIPSIGNYKDVELKPVNRSDAADDLKTDEDKKSEKKIEPLLKKIKKVLGDQVKDVRASARLSGSPSCIVADEKDPTIQMQQLLKSMGQTDMPEVKPVLELNPGHEIVQKLAGSDNEEMIEDAGRLLLEQALLLEGVQLKDPSGFVKRVNKVLTKSL